MKWKYIKHELAERKMNFVHAVKYTPLWRTRQMRRETMSGYRGPGSTSMSMPFSTVMRLFTFGRKPIETFPTLKNLRFDKYVKEVLNYSYQVIERGRYGYTAQDLFSLDNYLTEWLPMALAELATVADGEVRGFPCNEEDPNTATADAWQETLFKMAEGFHAHHKLVDVLYPRNETDEELSATATEGMELFVKYYGALWD